MMTSYSNRCSHREISLVVFDPSDHEITADHLPRTTREPKSNPSSGGRLQGERDAFSVPINGPKQLYLLRCVQNCMMSILREQICGNGAVESRETKNKV